MIDTDKYEGLDEVIDRIINSDEIGIDDLLADSMAVKDGINELLTEVKRLREEKDILRCMRRDGIDTSAHDNLLSEVKRLREELRVTQSNFSMVRNALANQYPEIEEAIWKVIE